MVTVLNGRFNGARGKCGHDIDQTKKDEESEDHQYPKRLLCLTAVVNMR